MSKMEKVIGRNDFLLQCTMMFSQLFNDNLSSVRSRICQGFREFFSKNINTNGKQKRTPYRVRFQILFFLGLVFRCSGVDPFDDLC